MKTLLISILLITLISKIAYASNLYDTDYYNVNFVSNNIEDYKINQIEKIKLKSINKILEDILIAEDYNEIYKILNIDTINMFVKNISIEDEIIINNNYSSNIKINFSKKKLINYLRNNKISYVDFIPSNFFTIILEKDELNQNTISKNNKIYKFLLLNKINNHFFKIPNIDSNDKYLMNNINIKIDDNTYPEIENILNKYKEKNALILILNKINLNTEYTLYIFTEGRLYLIDKFIFDDYKIDELLIHVKSLVVNNWKIHNKIDNTKIASINCNINYFNLLELKKIKQLISDVSNIKKINLQKISINNNEYELIFYGNFKMLRLLFLKKRLNIVVDDSECNISLK